MPQFIDLSGQKLGRWTVLYRDGTHKYGGAQWRCRCECGNEKTVRGQAIRSGDSKSCGCLNIDVHRAVCIERNTTHGHAARGGYSDTYRTWLSIGTRKFSPKYVGITVCDRWKSFENFLEDMGERPSRQHTIDRIDNALGYEPSNCRWATMKEQQNNRTNNQLITHNGETKTLMQWSETVGFDQSTIRHRLKLGWSIDKALTVKPRVGRNQYSET